MSSAANPSLPTSIQPFRLPQASLERRDPHSESTGSVSVNSPEKKKKKRRKMSTSEAGPSQSKQGEARWPPENEARFISLMLDQVILGKCIGQKFKQCNWMEIQEKLNDICGPEYYYEITQMTSKHDRLKQHWRRFYNMLNKDTGFGWESSTGKITGGGPVDHDSDRCTRRRRGTTSTFDTAMNSITEASRIIQQNARPEKDQESLQQALKALESLPNVPMAVRKLAWRKFRDPWSLYTFLGLELEENRLALLQMWMEDDGN
ncbi:PIF-like protein [Striga asiatica]|uniref:PIF-like protein n=1 Tax=Striga asiatica TaxID=4170 RepID=A0A5A7R2G9_STRAF|nr:PIF-like protein [Striga asiatica]